MSFGLSIFSYNIAGNTQDFAKQFMNNVIHNYKESISDVLIFCFQEMHGHFDDNFTCPLNSGLDVVFVQNGCQSVSTNFNLCTIIIKKQSYRRSIGTRSLKKCTHFGLSSVGGYNINYFGSKGAIYTIFSIHTESYFIINTHAPFASERGMIGGSYKNFWNVFIDSQIKKNKMKGKTFIVGDLNSRSLINTYLNISLTPTIKNATNIDFKYRQSQTQNQTTNYKEQVQQLLNKTQTRAPMTKQEQKKFQILKKRMIERDYLTSFLKDTMIRDISPINFLPTYKINEQTSQYKLMKNEKLRLPGYTDRILTDIHEMDFSKNITYKALKKFGNTDHFPVMGSFTLFLY